MFSRFKTDKRFRFFAISYIIFLIIALTPFVLPGIVSGSDHSYHLTRIKSIAEGINAGDFPVKVHSLSFDGYGYGNGLFYPNFFLFFPASLMVLGVSFELSYKIFLLCIYSAILFTSFYAGKRIFKSKTSACLTSFLFLTSQAFFTNMYELVTIGETLAIIFIPVVILALYNIVYKDFSQPQLLIIGFLGMVLCHTITLFLSIVISIAFLGCNYKKLLKDKEKAKRLMGKIAICGSIVLSLSIGYWLPMLEQFASGTFQFSFPWTHVSENALDLYQMFYTYRPGVGLVPLCFALVLVFHKKTRSSFSGRFIIAGLVIVLITTKLFPWRLLDYTFVNSIQFPRRFMPYAAAFLSLGVAGALTTLFSEKKMLKLSAIAIVLGCVLNLNHSIMAITNIIELKDDITSDWWANGCCEWLPADTDEDAMDSPNLVKTADGDIISVSAKNGTNVDFNISESSKNTEYFQIPLLYYKGYGAVITTENGETKTLRTECGTNNEVRVYGNGESGAVHVSYSGTTVQYLAYIINGVALVIVIALATWLLVKRKKQTSES